MPNLRFGNDAEPALRVRHQVIQVQEREGGGAATAGREESFIELLNILGFEIIDICVLDAWNPGCVRG